MKFNLIKIVLLLLFSTGTFGQSLWTKISEREINKSELRDRTTMPSTYQLFSLDLNLMKQQLQNAPLDNQSLISPNIIFFPDSEGKIVAFSVYEAPIMEAGLQVKYPSLKSYIATGIENPRTSLRFCITDFGLHAMSVTNEKGTYFIDSYTKDSSKYIHYYKKHCFTTKQFGCLTQPTNSAKNNQNENKAQSFLSSDGVFRQYRFAMTTSADYSQFHIDAAGVTNGTLAQKKSAVLSAVVVSMTRINGVFERDLGVRMNLVANNDLLISIGTDNFTIDNILDENIAFTNLNIGFDNYDVGHIVTLGSGGIAAYACICTQGKAAGTTGTNSPVGDPFDIDYVAHEMGHQFGGNHTFNNSCGDNVAMDYSVEPGSGSTIMSYAGICAPSVQAHADAYFSGTTIEEIGLTLNNPDSSCASVTSSTNTTPTITPLVDYVIPRRAAFILKGNATATNQNTVTYCWEQTNTEISTQPPLANSTTGPNYRSLMPSYSPDRYMPSFSNVMAGNLVPTWEVTPSVARTMNFALTVRDNAANGGQTQTANMNVQVKATSGTFRITSMNTVNTSYTPGASHNLTWNVAGTTANGINTATVTISISTDNGVTFSPLLVSTPNDGSALIQFPYIHSPYCRIMIAADLNIYYALSVNFCLGYQITTECTSYSDNGSIPIISDENGGFTTRTINVPQNGIVSDVNLYTNITHEYFGDFKMDISSPSNPDNYVLVYDGNCGDLNGTLNLKFTDGGSAITCTTGTTLQNVSPIESFYVFNGQNQEGDWTLRVYDHAAPDEGVVNSWSLEICREIATMICAPVVTATGSNKIWDGTNWQPSAPTQIDTATISASGSPGSFTCNTLAIGSNNITLLDGQTIEVVNGITGTGTISMSTAASILQRNDSSTIQPNISLSKRTRPNMYPLDYIYWGSPLVNTPLSMLNQATSVGGGGVAGAFDLKYKYVSGDLTTSGGWQALDAISSGKGFIMRIKQAAPFTTLNGSVSNQINLTFSGTANNGTITVPVTVTTDPTSSRNHNLLSNPYPSAIDADKFLAYNTNVDGVVYLWKAQTPNLGTGYNYSTADYIAYTRAGTTSESGISTELFNGKIASGQGFKVKALTTGDVVFNNCMRISGNNAGFMRAPLSSTVTDSSIDRYKLNLIGNNGVGNQILVAYMPETTLNYDRMYDAELNSVSSAQLYSILDNNTKKLAINSRPNFEITDVVNLGISKTGTGLQNFSIAIAEKEGIFAINNVSIYLHDTLLNQFHDFANGAYTCSINTVEINNRFQIVYQNGTLSNPIVASNNVKASIDNEILKIVSNLPMTNIVIYDISGRLVTEIKVENKLDITTPFYFEEGIYIAKIKLDNDTIFTQKLINKK